MPNAHDGKHNGHAMIGPKAKRSSEADEEMEPKGAPTSDRYRTETAHSHETHDPQQSDKKPHRN
jgi:hypothetical protein